jgi:hypothetical protein
MQIGLVVCTGLGFLLTSLKLPHYGVIANLIGQVFWVYSSYRAWREADQIGIFISTVIITLILIYGVTNYWLFGETFSVKALARRDARPPLPAQRSNPRLTDKTRK